MRQVFWPGLFLTAIVSQAGSGSAFTENKGQWPEQVAFRAMFAQHCVFVERDGFTVLVWSDDPGHQHARTDDTPPTEPSAHAYRTRFIGAAATVATGQDVRTDIEHHFIGRDISAWGANARRFGSVVISNLYPGIDLRAEAPGHFKYELLVQPGASTDDIVLEYEGHEALRLENGRLLIQTSVGTLMEEAPLVYQERNGSRIPIPCAYALDGDRLSYRFPEGYDRTLPLVIDPALVFASYSGSTAGNFAFCATYDADGHLYAGSTALATGYPVTLGSYQTSFGGGYADIALSKFSPDGSALIWSTYIGGAGNEYPVSLVVNAANELYLLATIGSADFPITPNAFDTVFNGGPAAPMIGIGSNFFPEGCDMAVLRLSPEGDTLLGSTLFGGTGSDGAGTATVLKYNHNDQARGGLILDASGTPVFASMTTSTDLPTTANAPQPASSGGQDGCVGRFSAGLDQLLWATYIGGSADDAAYGLCTNSSSEVIVVGGTDSGDLPMVGPSFSVSYGGAVDGFVARYASSGSQLLTSSYLGTSAYDQAFFVDVDALDNATVLGQSIGGYAITPGLYTVPGSANFLQQLSPDLSIGAWSTVFGNGSGTTDISPVAFALDYADRIHVAGFGALGTGPGNTNGLPVTADAFQPTTDGKDFYIATFSANAADLTYATYLGGGISQEHADGGNSRFNENGDLYLAVCSGCGINSDSDFPTTAGAWSTSNNGYPCNLVAVKFDLGGTMNVSAPVLNDEVVVWPTVVDDVLSVRGCHATTCLLTITDATGKKVMQVRTTAGTNTLDTSALSEGLYVAMLHDTSGRSVDIARFEVVHGR